MKKMNQNGVVKCDYYELLLEDWHGEYNIVTCPLISIRTMWNGYEINHAIESIQKIYGCTNEIDLRVVMNDVVFNPKDKWAPPMPACGEVQFPDSTLYCVSGNPIAMHDWIRIWSADLINRAPNVGGDDDYYDYFPTYIEMFVNACVDLGEKELFDYTQTEIERHIYIPDHPDHDEFPCGWFKPK